MKQKNKKREREKASAKLGAKHPWRESFGFPPPAPTSWHSFHKMLAPAYSLQIPSDPCQIKSPQKHRQNEQMAFSFLKTMCIIYTIFFFTWAVKLTASRVTEKFNTNNLWIHNHHHSRVLFLCSFDIVNCSYPVPSQLAMAEGRCSRYKTKSITDIKDKGFPTSLWLLPVCYFKERGMVLLCIHVCLSSPLVNDSRKGTIALHIYRNGVYMNIEEN